MSDQLSKSFVVLVNKEIAHVSSQLDSSLSVVFEKSKIGSTFQQADLFRKRATQACLEESNRTLVEPATTTVALLAEPISPNHACLVIDFPDKAEESAIAIRRLGQDHAALFKRLQATVKNLGQWREDDVEMNLKGGSEEESINELPPAFETVQKALARIRVYSDTGNATQRPDLHNALLHDTQFRRSYTSGPSAMVTNDREFAAFHQLLRCFYKDVRKIASNASSAPKASNFTVHFIRPPFFSGHESGSRGFQYEQEKLWGFPMFVDTEQTPNAFRKFTPRSDWMVTSPDFTIPFIISEVISNKTERDRYRMLVEATALARAGRFLLQSPSKQRFFVVAIYVNASMVVFRYIVMDTGEGDVEDEDCKKPVSIHKKDFNLKHVDQEVDFLREMYNLATEITTMAKHLNANKEEGLTQLKAAAAKILSLNSTKNTAGTIDSVVMGSVTQGATGSQEPRDEDNLGVFEAREIQSILHQMNYKIEFIPWGHPHLAVIASKFDDARGYLKFVKRENEINILRHLSELKSPSNHTITGVQFWPVQGGSVISMPVAGGWLTSLRHPNEHLWSVALQLIEAVAFMHENHVAHMDLKPQNVIIPLNGGRLSIIDFNVSIHISSPDTTYSGVVGTEEYLAPEVREGPYKPILTDPWSCGRTLKALCKCCRPSADRAQLLEIAKSFMHHDPEARPQMHTVHKWMIANRPTEGVAVQPILVPVSAPACVA